MHANTIKADIRRNIRTIEGNKKVLTLDFVKTMPDFEQRIIKSIQRNIKKTELLQQALKLNRVKRYRFLSDNNYFNSLT
jgi:hypothetical protein